MSNHEVATTQARIYWTQTARAIFDRRLPEFVCEPYTDGGQIMTGNCAYEIEKLAEEWGTAVTADVVTEWISGYAKLTEYGRRVEEREKRVGEKAFRRHEAYMTANFGQGEF